MTKLPFDPLDRAEQVEKIVLNGLARKYYRFRPARYYGGIATADLVGCSLLCAYCWNYQRNLFPEKSESQYYAAREVAKRLKGIIRSKGYNKVRLSGAEPILGEPSFEHLYTVLKYLQESVPWVDFILETNGLMLGVRSEFVRRLSKFHKLHVRVSIKGFDKESFEAISGAQGEFFDLPLKGLRDMIENGINAWPAIMYETFGPEGIGKLNQTLKAYDIRPEELEIEYLESYPFVLENLRMRKIQYLNSHLS